MLAAVIGAIALLGVAYTFLTRGPFSFVAQFDRDVALGLARSMDAPLVTDADLVPLPEPVQRYLRATGAVGQPRVRNYRVRFRGVVVLKRRGCRSRPNSRASFNRRRACF